MIGYFSGNGNSRYVATELGKLLCEEVFNIIDSTDFVEKNDDDDFGLVFPVYAWGVPEPVLDFMQHLPEAKAESMRIGQCFVWAVLTCGDDTGMAPERLNKALAKRCLRARAIYSIQMPNTYVILPGFDVDSEDVAEKKLETSRSRIAEISQWLMQRRETIDVVRGSLPHLKSALYPLKKIWACNGKKWHHTDLCIGCGECVAHCPMKNVALKSQDGKDLPVWGTDCCSCMACYHHCPVHAVAYGSSTIDKGQYYYGIKRQIQREIK